MTFRSLAIALGVAGLHEPDVLMKQMRAHMRMLDEMMQAMMEHQAAPVPQPKAHGTHVGLPCLPL